MRSAGSPISSCQIAAASSSDSFTVTHSRAVSSPKVSVNSSHAHAMASRL